MAVEPSGQPAHLRQVRATLDVDSRTRQVTLADVLSVDDETARVWLEGRGGLVVLMVAIKSDAPATFRLEGLREVRPAIGTFGAPSREYSRRYLLRR